MKLPKKRIQMDNIRKLILKILNNTNLPEFINILVVGLLELISNFLNYIFGSYHNPEDYLNSLVEFSKNTNSSQKIAIVTGANSGIGYVTAKYLYKAGYYVILACRSEQRALEALDKIKADGGEGESRFIKLDMSSLESVKQFVAEFEKLNLKLDLLVNNAGVLPLEYEETAEKFESNFGVNFVGQLVLTDLLIPQMNRPSKILNMTSITAYYANNFNLLQLTQSNLFNHRKNYSQSKLAIILYTHYLQEKLQFDNISVYAIHPGLVESKLLFTNPIAKSLRPLGNLFIKSPPTGCFTILRYALIDQEDDYNLQRSSVFMEENPFPSHKDSDNEKINELISYTREALSRKGIVLTSL